MAATKKASAPPTHPTVWVGLGLAVVGLLVAMYAYTGTRVYDIRFAVVAAVAAVLALAGILVAAWGRSIMASRAQRSRRGLIQQDAMKLAVETSAPEAMAEVVGSETVPTIAAPAEKRRFAFSMPKRQAPRERDHAALLGAFRRKQPASDDPRDPEVSATLAPAEVVEVALVPAPEPARDPERERVTMRCPQCSTTFSAEGVRPFAATCSACGFSATV